MEVPSGADPAPERMLGDRRPAISLDDIDRRLATVERGLGRVTASLAAVTDSLEATVSAAVATEVNAAAGDLRHAVSELGRILVRDVGKLPQMLTQHRREIVAEIRGAAAFAPAPASAPAPAEAPGPVAADGPSGQEPEPAAVGSEPEPDEAVGAPDSPSPPDDDGTGRRWRGRRRQSD